MSTARLAILGVCTALAGLVAPGCKRGDSAATTRAAEPAPLSSPLPVLAPSPNAGRRGTYFVRSNIDRYDFWVRVPEAYGDDNPAGLLLFLHGRAGPHSEEHHGQSYQPTAWDEALCDRFLLICVHASFGDGMQSDDVGNKVRASKWVIARVMADYKIIAGRGLLAAFSNGGRPQKELLHQLAEAQRTPTLGRGFPFTAVAMWSTVTQPRRRELPKTPAIAWFMYVGEQEWPFELIGVDGFPLYAELWRRSLSGGSFDVDFTVRPGHDHVMPDADMLALTAASFERADAFIAPFVYTPDFTDPALAEIVAQLAALRMGPALQGLKKLIAQSGGQPSALASSTRRLAALVEKRATRVETLFTTLLAQDPVLAVSYWDRHLQAQFAGHPLTGTLGKAVAEARAGAAFRTASLAADQWLRNAGTFIDDTPRVNPESLRQVKSVAAKLPPGSVLGRNVAAFVALGEGRLGNGKAKPVRVDFLPKVKVDGDADEWKNTKPLPAPFSKRAASHMRLAWNAEGLHGLVEVDDRDVRLDPGQEFSPDYVQVFIEKDFRRGYYLHDNAAEYAFAPGDHEPSDTDNGGRTRLVRKFGMANPKDDLACAWRRTDKGYRLEFSIRTHELAPARIDSGTMLGFHFAINDDGEPVEQFWVNKRENRAYETPKLWGAIQLSR